MTHSATLTVDLAPHRLDIRELIFLKAFPDQRHDRRKPLGGFRFPYLNHMVISLTNIEIHHHCGSIQNIAVRWYRTGFGSIWQRRPRLICPDCRKARDRLYFDARSIHINCRTCQGLRYASHQSSTGQRILLRRARIQTRLDHSPGMMKKTRRRWEARLRALPVPKRNLTKRLSHPRMSLPLNWIM